MVRLTDFRLLRLLRWQGFAFGSRSAPLSCSSRVLHQYSNANFAEKPPSGERPRTSCALSPFAGL